MSQHRFGQGLTILGPVLAVIGFALHSWPCVIVGVIALSVGLIAMAWA